MRFSDSAPNEQSTNKAVAMEFNEVRNEVEYEEILEKIGFGKTQWLLLFISGLMILNSISAQQSVGIIVIASQCEFSTNQSEKGIMLAACVAGIFVSTYLWGYVCDAFGRRRVLLYALFLTNFLEILTMFITNVWAFNVVNFFIGINIGGVSASMYAYLSEFNVNKYRAIVINYSNMFVSIAGIYVPAVSWLVLHHNWSLAIFDGFVFRPWRLIMLFSALPGFIAALLLLIYPESPKLLLAQQKEKEAEEAINWICKFNKHCTVTSLLENRDYKLKPELSAAEDVLSTRNGCGIFVSIWKATLPLGHKPHRKNFLISIVVVLGLFFCSSGMQMWFPEIANRTSVQTEGNVSTVCEVLDASFKQQSLTANLSSNDVACDDTIAVKTYVDNIIVGCVFLIGFILQGPLLKVFGNKIVIYTTLIIGFISGVLLHFVSNKILLLVVFCFYIILPGLSISVMLATVVELVPTHLRAKAVAICLTFGRLGIMIATNLIGAMLEPLCNTTFAIFTCVMLACGVLLRFLPIK
ncbi:synaptic vesicle glycoprotein 2B-like [Teleopsis dalmanni]|uniref:synaptic vesicle glycoprotein 2B-like n=1 Tax=Teleopsis dalmanni TaxID=139649 RepID=UPI0018CF9F00|nr:synaptic vesicle glycoprotein 2B-like [Teleopsis dalmanni]